MVLHTLHFLNLVEMIFCVNLVVKHFMNFDDDISWAQPNDITNAASDETLCGLIHAPSVAVETGPQGS